MRNRLEKNPGHKIYRSGPGAAAGSGRMAKAFELLVPAHGEDEMGTKAIWTIAHRGASGHAPENTMAAFRRAVELGARFIETDLHLTRDARVVAMHDSTLDR